MKGCYWHWILIQFYLYIFFLRSGQLLHLQYLSRFLNVLNGWKKVGVKEKGAQSLHRLPFKADVLLKTITHVNPTHSTISKSQLLFLTSIYPLCFHPPPSATFTQVNMTCQPPPGASWDTHVTHPRRQQVHKQKIYLISLSARRNNKKRLHMCKILHRVIRGLTASI